MLSDLKIHMNLYEYVIKYQLSRLKFPFSASLLIESNAFSTAVTNLSWANTFTLIFAEIVNLISIYMDTRKQN